MAFTYDLTTSGTALVTSQVRLEIGDTDSASALFQDAELQVYIDRHPDSVALAASDACDQLARRYGRAYDFETDGQSFKRSQMSKQYAQLARELRERKDGILATSSPTRRVDGYSDDIAFDEVQAASSRTGRVKAGYYSPDLPS